MHGPTCIFWANLTTFSLQACAAPSLALAAFFGAIEAVQLHASRRPLFGDAALRMWPDHVFDPYNLLDVAASAAVLATVGARAHPLALSVM